MAATDWNALFDDLIGRVSAPGRDASSPERLAEFIRDKIRPKCLALLLEGQTPRGRYLAWAHGFDLPAERVIPGGHDAFSWLLAATGLKVFGRRTQAYATPVTLDEKHMAWLCAVSNRRGRALVMEQMFVATAGALVGRLRAADKAAAIRPKTAEQLPAPGSAQDGGAPRRTKGAVLTISESGGRTEQKLALAIEHASEAIVFCDATGRIEYVNPAFKRTTGYTRSEALGQTPRILKSGVNSPNVYRAMWKTILAGQPWAGSLVNRRKNGRLYDTDLKILPVLGEQNAVAGFVSIGEDVSERQQHERERAALARACLATSGALNLSVSLKIILQSAVQATAADGGAVVFLGRTKEEFASPVRIGVLAGDESAVRGFLEAVEKTSLRPHERVSVLLNPPLSAQGDLRSVALLPLQIRGDVMGITCIVARRPDAFPEHLRPALESLASLAAMAVTHAVVSQDAINCTRVYESILQITRTLRTASRLDSLVDLLAQEAARTFKSPSAAILLLDPSEMFLSPRATRGQFTVMKGSFPLKDSVLELPLQHESYIIANEAEVAAFLRLTGVSRLGTLILVPLSTGTSKVGVLILGRQEPVPYSRSDLDMLAVLTDMASTAIHRVRLREELEEAYVGTSLALAEAVDARDSYVAGHAQRTGLLAERVAGTMGIPEDQIQHIRYGAILHDVGKISVPDSILRKIGPLTPDEWQVIRRHTIAGARILGPVARLAHAAEIVRYHHERWDGTGYPEGLRGEQIPLGARVVAVVDAYTAMVDDRTYRKAKRHEEALEELKRNAGTQFDPTVVDAFIRVVSSGNFLV